MTVQEAARRLGVKDDAIRKRIQRGTLEHDKDPDGRVYVYLDATHDAAEDNHRGSSRYDAAHDASSDAYHADVIAAKDETISELRAQLGLLHRELEVRNDELRRKDHLLAAALERIPAIEAPPDTLSEPRESPQAASEKPSGTHNTPPEEERRSLWRRIFGG